MEVIKAVERLNKLKEDADKIDRWLAGLKTGDRPVNGKSWYRLEQAISDVMHDVLDEEEELEKKIIEATKDIEI